jgi:2-aminoethylphosphonate-pyruvate transaminase
MQGSGSFGVESVLTTAIKPDDVCLFISNGAYGERMIAMAKYIGLQHREYRVRCDQIPDAETVRSIFEQHKEITHVALVHCETTTGILNPLETIASLCKEYGKSLIVDAMSSFGGIQINIQRLGIDYLISSANKCIQGVPGFCFILANITKLAACQGNARSLSLDLYEQWREMDKYGKWRYTSPTHVVAAFSKALDELSAEGGVSARNRRYRQTNALLRNTLAEIGIVPYIAGELQSPIITSFLFPNANFDFSDFYRYVKARGFILYPGKLTDADTFRIGNIGEIYPADIVHLCEIITDYMKGK